MKTARRHVARTEPSQMAFELPWWRPTREDEEPVHCPYCRAWTDDYDDPDLWDLSFDEFAAVHYRMVGDPEFPGPSPESLHSQLRGDISGRKTCLHICPLCGWWVAEDSAILPAKRWQHWVVTLAASSVLQEFSLADIETPVREVRRYLVRCFDSRMSVHPRLFELAVASVFKDFGYQAAATAYSHDGGIDVVLVDAFGHRIGVQVKRRRAAIDIEQIRAFLGALVLGGYSRGVFVSTSRFCRGAYHAASRSGACGTPIELVDANRFFDMLGYAQFTKAAGVKNCGISRSKPPRFLSSCHYHLNSL